METVLQSPVQSTGHYLVLVLGTCLSGTPQAALTQETLHHDAELNATPVALPPVAPLAASSVHQTAL